MIAGINKLATTTKPARERPDGEGDSRTAKAQDASVRPIFSRGTLFERFVERSLLRWIPDSETRQDARAWLKEIAFEMVNAGGITELPLEQVPPIAEPF